MAATTRLWSAFQTCSPVRVGIKAIGGLRAGSRSDCGVTEVHDAGLERARFELPESDAAFKRREERRACPEDDGVDEEPVLVDEAAFDERRGECRTADVEVAVELHLEPRELFADVARDDAAIPLHGLERR